MQYETIQAWKDDNPKPRRRDYEDKDVFRDVRKRWRLRLNDQRDLIREHRSRGIERVMESAKDVVLQAAARALPGEEKREWAIREMLQALDRAFAFPPTVAGKIAEMGTDWLIYHPLRMLVESTVDEAYTALLRAGDLPEDEDGGNA